VDALHRSTHPGRFPRHPPPRKGRVAAVKKGRESLREKANVSFGNPPRLAKKFRRSKIPGGGPPTDTSQRRELCQKGGGQKGLDPPEEGHERIYSQKKKGPRRAKKKTVRGSGGVFEKSD